MFPYIRLSLSISSSSVPIHCRSEILPLLARKFVRLQSMPGPKMGKRPVDFDEEGIRKAPTFQKWLSLKDGENLKYACRTFQKGNENDEERLMRRIMIARRNNVRDHEILKKAREVVVHEVTATSNPAADSLATASKKVKNQQESILPPKMDKTLKREYFHDDDDDEDMGDDDSLSDGSPRKHKHGRKKTKKTFKSTLSGNGVEQMDEAAVMATRSYRTWLELEDGSEFSYNQKYIKGKEGHDYLLKKNIWRRMRYRRENKKMVEKLKCKPELVPRLILRSTVSSKKSKGGMRRGASTTSSSSQKAKIKPKVKEEEEQPTDTLELGDISVDMETHASLSFVEPIMNTLVAGLSSSSQTATMPPLDAVALEFDGAALDAAYKLAAATANVEEVAAAVAAVIQGTNDDTSTEGEEDDFHMKEECDRSVHDPKLYTNLTDV